MRAKMKETPMATSVAPKLQQYLDEASFPISKADLLANGRQEGLRPDDLALLGRLPDQTYMTQVDASLAIAEVQAAEPQQAERSRTPRRQPTRTTSTAKPKARPRPNVKSEASQATDRITKRITGVAKEELETRKGQASTQLGRVAESLRENEQQFRSAGDAMLADVAAAGASGLEQATDFLASQDIDAVAQRVRSAVQRRPAVAVGAALAIGFMGARFLKAGVGGPPPEDRPKNQNER
jgi:hypothetical protein